MLSVDDLKAHAAGRPGICCLCKEQYPPGVQIVALGLIDKEAAYAHLQPCMKASLDAGEGSLGWDRAYRSMVPTKHAPTLWIKDGRLRFMAPYDRDGFDALKAIAGRSYHADPKPHWSFPAPALSEVLAAAKAWPGLKVAADLASVRSARGDRIGIEDGRVLLRCHWSETGSDLVRAVPGARWNGDARAWSFPIERMEEALIAAQAGWRRLQIEGSFLRQRRLEQQASGSAVAHTSAQVIEYPGVGRLFGYQTEGVRFLQARAGRGLLGDEMGLGKTIQILAYAREAGVGEGLRAVFVVPAAVRVNWAREAAKWTGIAPELIFLCGIKPSRRYPSPFRLSRARRPIPADVAIVIINYDILGRWLHHLVAARFDLVVFDEAHYLQNSRAQRSRQARYLCHGIRSQHDLGGWLPRGWEIVIQPPTFSGDATTIGLRRRDGDEIVDQTRWEIGNAYSSPTALTELLTNARRRDPKIPELDLTYAGIPQRIEATGTPIMNRPNGLWHLLHLLDPDAWGGRDGGYKAFTARYMGGYVSHWGKWSLGDRATNTQELHQRLIGTYMARRLKADVLTELPAKTVNRVFLEPSSTELRAYHDLSDEIGRVREEYERQKVRAAAAEDPRRDEILIEARRLLGSALGKAAQLRRALGVCKVPAVIRWLQQLLDAEEPIVVFAWHQDVQNALLAALVAQDVPTVHVFSRDQPLQRVAAIDAFQAGEARAIVCSIKAAGAGITLHKAAHTVHIERAWNPADNDQAEDRIHRIGQVRLCFSWYLDVPGTFDDTMDSVCDVKKRDQQLVLDGQLIQRDGSTYTQRAVLADFIGLTSEDLELLDG